MFLGQGMPDENKHKTLRQANIELPPSGMWIPLQCWGPHAFGLDDHSLSVQTPQLLRGDMAVFP